MNTGWIVYDLSGRAATVGRTSEAAIATAETLGAMPLRARIARATADDAPRWWRA